MRTILIALIAACGTDEPATLDCATLSMQVTQDKTTCTISHAGITQDGFGCAFVQWAYCGTDCPQGWQLSCDGSMTEPVRDCTYDGMCTGPGAEFSTYNASQIYEGQRGLAVEIEPGRCVFRACE